MERMSSFCLSGETLNQGPDSLWSLKIPGCSSKKSRGVTPESWPNSPIGLRTLTIIASVMEFFLMGINL